MKKLFYLSVVVALFISYAQSQTDLYSSQSDYELTPEAACCDILYSDTTDNKYLRDFRETYQLDTLYKAGESTLHRATKLLHRTNRQWQHNGGNSAGTSNAITILERAANGERFSCAEYAIVFATAASAAGIPARVLNLKTKDVETSTSGAGHSLAEAYIKELEKWVMFDPQSDLVTYYNTIPLNAVELTIAIQNHRNQLRSFFRGKWGSNNLTGQVINWFLPYLYSFDVSLDNRFTVSKKYTCANNDKLFLIPRDEKAPTVFQK